MCLLCPGMCLPWPTTVEHGDPEGACELQSQNTMTQETAVNDMTSPVGSWSLLGSRQSLDSCWGYSKNNKEKNVAFPKPQACRHTQSAGSSHGQLHLQCEKWERETEERFQRENGGVMDCWMWLWKQGLIWCFAVWSYHLYACILNFFYPNLCKTTPAESHKRIRSCQLWWWWRGSGGCLFSSLCKGFPGPPWEAFPCFFPAFFLLISQLQLMLSLQWEKSWGETKMLRDQETKHSGILSIAPHCEVLFFPLIWVLTPFYKTQI